LQDKYIPSYYYFVSFDSVGCIGQLAVPGSWIGTIDDPETFLVTRGLPASLTLAGEEESNYVRWPYPVMLHTIPDLPRN